jgi:hypothetical protein
MTSAIWKEMQAELTRKKEKKPNYQIAEYIKKMEEPEDKTMPNWFNTIRKQQHDDAVNYGGFRK